MGDCNLTPFISPFLLLEAKQTQFPQVHPRTSCTPTPRPHLVVLLWICSSIDISYYGTPLSPVTDAASQALCRRSSHSLPAAGCTLLCSPGCSRPSWAVHCIILLPTMCPPYHSSFSGPLCPSLHCCLGLFHPKGRSCRFALATFH